jgi:hypothetical protein
MSARSPAPWSPRIRKPTLDPGHGSRFPSESEPNDRFEPVRTAATYPPPRPQGAAQSPNWPSGQPQLGPSSLTQLEPAGKPIARQSPSVAHWLQALAGLASPQRVPPCSRRIQAQAALPLQTTGVPAQLSTSFGQLPRPVTHLPPAQISRVVQHLAPQATRPVGHRHFLPRQVAPPQHLLCFGFRLSHRLPGLTHLAAALSPPMWPTRAPRMPAARVLVTARREPSADNLRVH